MKDVVGLNGFPKIFQTVFLLRDPKFQLLNSTERSHTAIELTFIELLIMKIFSKGMHHVLGKLLAVFEGFFYSCVIKRLE